ncbi:MAG: phytanoyl-CoA dioxygenase family protein [Acidimicrobiales bacterium]|nr:phytanoyl-CoA dioxygenase family protein [Acidimicrobiales bacterium]
MSVVTRFTANDATVDGVVAAMQTEGYCIVEGMMPKKKVAATKADLLQILAETPIGRNDFEGYSTQRIYALFAKTRMFDEWAIHPLMLGVLDRILYFYQLSAPVGIYIGPGEVAQGLHKDQSVYPLPDDFAPVVVNTMWAFDDFTKANGATRLIPKSHKWTDRRPSGRDKFVYAEMPAGSVMFYPGNAWHSGGANTTSTPRLGVILEYVSAWLRPQENHVLAVPREVAVTLPERLQELLGYNIFPPFVGYVDGRHPRRYIEEPVRR